MEKDSRRGVKYAWLVVGILVGIAGSVLSFLGIVLCEMKKADE